MAASFPALAINTQGEGPLKEYAQIEQIMGARQSLEMGKIQLQEAKVAQQSRQEIMSLFAKNGGDLNQTLADAKASGKVAPDALIALQTHAVDIQTKAALLNKTQLENEEKTNDIFANKLEAFKQLPVEQRTPEAIKGVMSELAGQGVDISKYIPAFQMLAKNPSDDTLNSIEIGVKGRIWAANNAKAQLEEASAATPEEIKAQRKATFDKTVADTNEAAAKASLELIDAKQKGQVTPKDVYDRQTALLKSVYDRQTSFANTLQQSGLKQLDSMFTDPQHGYVNFLAQAQNTKNTIAQARNGNEVAASLEPLMTALGVTSFAGVHRINQTEVNAAGPAVGSMYRKVNAMLDKMGSGKVPEDTLKETEALIDGMIDSKHASIVNGAKMVSANAGLDPSKVTVMGRDGTLKTLDKAEAEAPKREAAPSAAPSGPPAGATHTARGSDGKLHWTDSTGSKDLGIVP